MIADFVPAVPRQFRRSRRNRALSAATAACARRPAHHRPACGFLRHAAANLGINDGLSFLVNTPSRVRSSAAGEGDPLIGQNRRRSRCAFCEECHTRSRAYGISFPYLTEIGGLLCPFRYMKSLRRPRQARPMRQYWLSTLKPCGGYHRSTKT